MGANKSLVIQGLGVHVEENGLINIRFEGVHGSPSVSGICIRKSRRLMSEFASEIEHSSLQVSDLLLEGMKI